MTPRSPPAHLARAAVVYCRQSTLIQVERNRESTLRQYDLAGRAAELGWPRPAIRVIDADLGVSGSGLAARAGFAELTEQIALGQVGVVLALEVSRLARSSAEWYRLLDLCGITDTLIADESSVYHPGMFDDRLLLGLKGTMAEAELQVLRARMLGGLRNKAGRGELRVKLRPGWSGARRPGRSCCTRTRRSAAPSARCSSASQPPARRGRCGCGCAKKTSSCPASGTASWPGRPPPTRPCTRS